MSRIKTETTVRYEYEDVGVSTIDYYTFRFRADEFSSVSLRRRQEGDEVNSCWNTAMDDRKVDIEDVPDHVVEEAVDQLMHAAESI